MNELILHALRCPVCHSGLEIGNHGKSLVCLGGEKRHHCYDFSSAGYVNFAPPSQSHSGDSKEAVRSRTNFLEKGFYDPVRNTVAEMVKKYSSGLTVDAGCGEGYYTNGISEFAKAIIGFDLSKYGVEAAAKKAGKNHIENAFFGVAGIYDMPLFDNCVDGIISIFAPCATGEFNRVLKEKGILIVAGAGKDHLLGIKSAVYKAVYRNTERVDMPTDMEKVEEEEVKYNISLSDNQEIMNLFSMTPYYYRTSEEDFAKLKRMEKLTTPVNVFVRVYRKKKGVQI